MSYIHEYKTFHKLASKAPMSHSWRDASSWGLIAELARRLPPSETFLAYECPYAEGIPHTVWYLRNNPTAENPQGDLQIRINNVGHVDIQAHETQDHLCLINNGLPSKKESRFHSLDFIFSPNPKQIVLEVESCYRNGENLPNQAPATRTNTVGARVIAAALALFLHTKSPLRISGYLFDGVEPRTDLVDQFPSLKKHIAESKPDLDQLFFIREAEPPSQDIFESEPARPILAINLKTGTAFTHHDELNLMQSYQTNNRNIDALAFELVQDARKVLS